MSPIVAQTFFLAAYLCFLVALRQWAHEYARRRADAERRRRAALEREWRVGIPYDPEDEGRGR